MTQKVREVSTLEATIFLLLLAGLVSYLMLVLELTTRLSLLLALVFNCFMAMFYGHNLKQIENYIIEGVRRSAFVITILIIIGCVIGSWIAAGIIPSIIYYGLETLNPTFFMVGGLVSCSLVAYFTGSSYACVGTIGVALMGIGQGLGIPLPITAGVILSGAMFGDKMSPFSDTTNLAAGTAGVPIFDHIRSMTYTTVPAWIIAAIIFYFIGTLYSEQQPDTANIQNLQEVIKTHFNIHPLLLFVPAGTIILAIRKTPTVIAMAFGGITGMVIALVFQTGFDTKIQLMSLINGLEYDFGNEEANNLFANRGGMTSMFLAMTIGMMAMIMGEIMARVGILLALIKGLEKAIVSKASLVICSLFSCFITNMLSASQYVSIVMPGMALKPLYIRRKVSRRVLSRSLEDGGTLLSVTIPWSSDAIFVSTALGVSTLAYVPYAYFILLCPLFSIFYALIGFAVWDDEGETNIVQESHKI
jgi:Na+:H+ antiporter, NhaC family